eukprot:COSAG06_NODE_7370_length_2526_cov_14.737948_1_plen_132_part_00
MSDGRLGLLTVGAAAAAAATAALVAVAFANPGGRGAGDGGPGRRILAALQAGGQPSVRVVSDVLEHGIEVLERAALVSPRKSRKGLRIVLERAEEMLEGVARDESVCRLTSQERRRCWCGWVRGDGPVGGR